MAKAPSTAGPTMFYGWWVALALSIIVFLFGLIFLSHQVGSSLGLLAGRIPVRRDRRLLRGLRGGRGTAADRGDPEPFHRRESPAGVPRGADTVAAASGGGRKLMGYSTILVDRTDAVATITLNRPQARNALDLVMRRELLAALDELEAEAAVRVVHPDRRGRPLLGGRRREDHGREAADRRGGPRARGVAQPLRPPPLRVLRSPRSRWWTASRSAPAATSRSAATS